MKVHFIAIGGSAMHNLAIALKINGFDVSGSDDEIFEPSRSRLKKYGLLPKQDGWHPENISRDLDFIILGMHAHLDNPELNRAREMGLKIYSYPEFLYEHSKNKRRVVIGGSHGKTTITAMVMHVLKYHGINFDYLVGSKLRDFEVMVRLSNDAQVMIFEGDEYLSSPLDKRPKFHWYHPHLALITGIAWDHINVFPTFSNYLEQFEKFMKLMEPESAVVYNYADSHVKNIVEDAPDSIHKIPYSLPNYKIIDGITHLVDGERLIPIKVFGKHNLMNLAGAGLLCEELGLERQQFLEAIQSFEGAAKRLELVYENKNGKMFKDFAHAPSKLKATLSAVREQFPKHHLIACFELHTYSSLNPEFLSQYKDTLEDADEAAVYFNPHALKIKRMSVLKHSDITSAFNRGDLNVFDESKKLENWLLEKSNKLIIFLMMSSGNFNGMDFSSLSKRLLE
jgi:UDP-N-acetylmuramate: L-alanyl-gamma-D-glutamyl-meso-diaminopimelate ligase